MNWKKPKTNIFRVPIPYTGQFLYKITEYKRNPETPPLKMEFTDPNTSEQYTAEILDYWGIYEADKIPDAMARLCTDIKLMTGEKLLVKLKQSFPEFKKAQLILIYELNKL